MDKKEALSQFHRAQITAAAEGLFARQGIEKTTMDEIAKVAQYSKATLYAYFKSKEEIRNSIALKSMRLLQRRLADTAGIAGIRERYFAICQALVGYWEEYPLYFETALGTIDVDIDAPQAPPLLREIYAVGEQINDEISRFLQDGIAQGVLRADMPVRKMVFFFWGSLAGLVRLAGKKEAYIGRAMGEGRQSFLQFCFETLLRCAAAQEGGANHG